MSKVKSAYHFVRAGMSGFGAVSTATGHGLIYTAASACRIRLSPSMLRPLIKYQAKSASEQWDKAIEEWKRE